MLFNRELKEWYCYCDLQFWSFAKASYLACVVFFMSSLTKEHWPGYIFPPAVCRQQGFETPHCQWLQRGSLSRLSCCALSPSPLHLAFCPHRYEPCPLLPESLIVPKYEYLPDPVTRAHLTGCTLMRCRRRTKEEYCNHNEIMKKCQ